MNKFNALLAFIENKGFKQIAVNSLTKHYPDLHYLEEPSQYRILEKWCYDNLNNTIMEEFQEQWTDTVTYMNVLQHFSQDEDPLLLEQEFEKSCEGNVKEELYELWRNEY